MNTEVSEVAHALHWAPVDDSGLVVPNVFGAEVSSYSLHMKSQKQEKPQYIIQFN